MVILKKLKIKGFRAYMQEQEFAFDNPVVLLFGENHRGKSSTLNAIEWCLFGNECIGIKSGIRERVDWEIPNRNLGSRPHVVVELELEDENKKNYKILRRWVSKTKDELKVTLSDGQTLEGQNGEKKLSQLLKSSFRDFLTTVYQHQEAIRSILTQEPRERNDAIDRLLGLSDYRNILSGIELAKLSSKQKDMGNNFDSFTREIYVALATREHDLKDKREEASQKGVKEEYLNEGGVLSIANEVKKQLQKFVFEIGLNLAELQVPEQWKELQQFQDVANEEIERFRSEMPDVKKQNELFSLRTKFEQLKTEYEGKKEKLRSASKELEKFIKDKGNEESLNKEKSNIEKQISEKEKEISETDAKAAAISNAIYYLRLEKVNKNICPVCGKDTTNLLGHLEKEWEEKYKVQVGTIQEQIDNLRASLKDIESLLTQYKKLEEGVKPHEKEKKEVSEEIGKALNMKITEKEDPLILLNNQSDRIEEELKKFKQSVASKQETLNGIATLLEKIRLIKDILNLEEKRKIVEQIKQLQEYQQIERLKDRMAELADDVENIKQAISGASQKEAGDKVNSAAEMIGDYFRRIANNLSVEKIDFSVSVDSKTARNNYEFKNQNGENLTPVLSQGDLNALALSIFLGMANLKGAAQQFGYVMLDDPSQSLGSEHKNKLVEVLDEVLKERMVILSSMDKELQDSVLSKITKAKTKYTFTNWTPEQGPVVEKEE